MSTNLIKNGLFAFFLIGNTLLVACSSNLTQTTKPTTTEVNPSAKIAQGNGTIEHGMNHHMSMDIGPADAEYDLRFIDAMEVHHQGAVEMAQAALDKSQHPPLKKLAKDIISAQTKEIEQMNMWRKAWYPKADNTTTMTKQKTQNMMMSVDLGKADTKFDLRFIQGMIPHHEGALIMAKDALNKSKRPEILELAQNILNSQQKEIKTMENWQKDWYGQ